MKAISLWQPWASAIVWGYKSVETRGWSTRHRGPLLIHAGAKMDFRLRFIINELDIDGTLPRGIYKPLGCIVGAVDLINVSPVELIRDGLSERERNLGDYTDDRYGWMFKSIRRFVEPIPYKAIQGLFNVPDALVAAAMEEAVAL